MNKQNWEEERKELIEILNHHEDFGIWLRKEGYASDYVKNFKCTDFADIIISYASSMLDEKVKALEAEEKKYCKGFQVNTSVCIHCHNNWNYNKALKVAINIIKGE